MSEELALVREWLWIYNERTGERQWMC